MDLDFAIRNSYGVLRAGLLCQSGMSRYDIRKAANAGTLHRLRHGWYATPDHNADVAAAVRAGGVLSCISALKLHGVWTPEHTRVHMRLTDHAQYRGGRSTTKSDALQCGQHLGDLRPARAVDPLMVALSAASGCVSDEELVAIIDSMLYQRKCVLGDVRDALEGRSIRVRRLLNFVDERAESGTESVARYRLARINVNVRPQVRIRGLGRVDLVVGQRLVLELDSVEHHTNRLAYETDRHRDLTLHTLGYLCVRLTYRQVFDQGEAVMTSLLTLIRRREHYFQHRHRRRRNRLAA